MKGSAFIQNKMKEWVQQEIMELVLRQENTFFL